MLAFSTANGIPHYPKESTYSTTHLTDAHLIPLITATVEATEEAILNALTMATTITGRGSHRIAAIDLVRLRGFVTTSRVHFPVRSLKLVHSSADRIEGCALWRTQGRADMMDEGAGNQLAIMDRASGITTPRAAADWLSRQHRHRADTHGP